jgi:ATP synthase protein I
MSDKRDLKRPPPSLEKQVGVKEARKLRARRQREQRIWFGLGMFGVVGWTVVVPTLLGLGIGIWIDRSWPSQYSFTLMGLLGGLITGIISAWYWVNYEGNLIERQEKDEDQHE